DRSPAPYAAESAKTYAVSRRPDRRITPHATRLTLLSGYIRRTGEQRTAPTIRAPDWISSRRASLLTRRFQVLWHTAAPSTSTSAASGIARVCYAWGRMSTCQARGAEP